MSRFLLIKGRPGTGLGDHIITLVSGLIYAARHGLVTCVDWRDGSLGPRSVNAFPHLFEIVGLPMVAELPESGDVHPPVWRGHLGTLAGDLYRQNGEIGWDRAAFANKYSTDVLTPPRAEVSVHVLSDHLRELVLSAEPGSDADDRIRGFVRRHVRPVKAVRDEVEAFASSHPGGCTGLHLRMTDKSPAREADYVRSYRSLPAAARRQPLFLATDSLEAEQRMRSMLRGTEILTRAKWMPETATPIHLAESNPDLLQTTRDALADLRILSLCEPLLIHPASSFGVCAGFFAQQQPVRVRSTSRRPLVERVADRLRRALKSAQHPAA